MRRRSGSIERRDATRRDALIEGFSLGTHRIERSPGLQGLHHLDRREVATLGHHPLRGGYLGKADGAGIRIVAWASEPEHGHHGRVGVGLRAEAEVDVHEGRGVPCKPARLHRERAVGDWPRGAVLCGGQATT